MDERELLEAADNPVPLPGDVFPGTARLRAVAERAAAEQREKDAVIADRVYPLGALVLGDAPSKIAAAIRAGNPKEDH